jgi:quinol monooxygenase YgiN
MIVVHVSIQVKPEHAAAFEAACIENARASALEHGVVRFEFLKQTEEPNRYALWEVYRDEESIAAHRLTPHYAKWAATVGDMMAAPRIRTLYSTVYP